MDYVYLYGAKGKSHANSSASKDAAEQPKLETVVGPPIALASS